MNVPLKQGLNEQQALAKMIAPGTPRPGKYRQGVIQIMITRACNLSCYNCTQGSNYAGKPSMMTVQQFEQACQSLKGYWGVVGVFGGNPAMHPHFEEICSVLRSYFPREQRGLWCNHPMGKGKTMRVTFDPAISNLNVHLDRNAYNEFRRDWPEAHPFGLREDSRHSPVFVAMRDVLKKKCPPPCNGRGGWEDENWVTHNACNATGQVYDEEKAWELISSCDINQHWSALIGTFRGQLRAWFCEIAGAQAMLHEWEKQDVEADVEGGYPAGFEYTYPDTGLDPTMFYNGYLTEGSGKKWWQLPMTAFAHQVRKHCHDCGVPLRGYGELSQSANGIEQHSETHVNVCKPKRTLRQTEMVTDLVQLGVGRLSNTTKYLQNANL